jgi:outer membrane protein TolC
MKKQYFNIFLTIFIFAGCSSVGPTYEKPKVVLEKEWLNYEKKSLDMTPPLEVKWWDKAFKDETLNTLIETALSDNLTLRSAGLRVLQARQKLFIALGNKYPQYQSINA